MPALAVHQLDKGLALVLVHIELPHVLAQDAVARPAQQGFDGA